MCQGGNSRSVGCAFLLKYQYGVDALACGWEKNSKETLNLLFSWADYIIIMQGIFAQYVTEEYHKKLIIVDVGEDIWFNSLHPDLLKRCNEILQKIIVVVPQEAVSESSNSKEN